MSHCEPPSLYRERMVFAKKQHECFECGHPIFPSEKYQRVDGLWDGEWATFATCHCCSRARCALTAELDFEECIAFGELAEEMRSFEQCRGPLNAIITVPPESI